MSRISQRLCSATCVAAPIVSLRESNGSICILMASVTVDIMFIWIARQAIPRIAPNSSEIGP